jgi:hypothetical protein
VGKSRNDIAQSIRYNRPFHEVADKIAEARDQSWEEVQEEHVEFLATKRRYRLGHDNNIDRGTEHCEEWQHIERSFIRGNVEQAEAREERISPRRKG